MKKLFLVFVLVVGLNASSFICDDSVKRIKKYNVLFSFAHEENNIREMVFTNNQRLSYAGKAIANCDSEKYSIDALSNLRKSYLKLRGILSELQSKQ